LASAFFWERFFGVGKSHNPLFKSGNKRTAMSYMDKILGIAGMGSTLANVSMLRRFLTGVTVVIALTAVSSTMAGMIIIVALYGLYLALMHHGLDPQAAVIAVSAFAVIITALLATLAFVRWRQLKDMPHFMNSETSIASQVHQLVDAFVGGLLSGRERSSH
jgi:hypothetical protein